VLSQEHYATSQAQSSFYLIGMMPLMLVPMSSYFRICLTTCIQIFAVHAIGGLVGNVLTGFFAQASVAGFDGKTKIRGGWLDHNWPQVGIQLANSAAGMAYSFVVTVRDPVLQ
jgi:ammonia channel protein AmtB